MDKVKAACDSARQNPGEENSFRQLRLNQWVKQAVRWMPMEKWDDEPNPEMSSFIFRETLMTHLLLWGNAYHR